MGASHRGPTNVDFRLLRVGQVNTFVSRSPRFGLDLPIRFFSEDGLEIGRCVDVSESGLLGFFERPLSVWTSGELTASLGDDSVSVKARVARVEGRQAGLSFQSENENDRLAILKLIDFALRNGQ